MRKEKSAALKDFLPPLKVVFKAVAKTFWKRRKCKFRIVLCLILLLLFQFQLCKYRKKYVFATIQEDYNHIGRQFNQNQIQEDWRCIRNLSVIEPSNDTYVRGGKYSSSNFGNEAGLLLKCDSEISSSEFSRKILMRFQLIQMPEHLCLALYHSSNAISFNENSITFSNLNMMNWEEKTVTWDHLTDAKIVDKLAYKLPKILESGWLLFSGLQKFVAQDLTLNFVIEAARELSMKFESKESKKNRPKLLLSSCPKSPKVKQIQTSEEIKVPLLDESYPSSVQVISHATTASLPEEFRKNILNDLDSTNTGFRTTNPVFHRNSILVRYTDAHQCSPGIKRKKVPSSILLETDSAFSSWKVAERVNIRPNFHPKCYQGIEDPRSFNSSHFLGSIQDYLHSEYGGYCVQRQAFISKEKIVLLNSLVSTSTNEKNWVHFQDNQIIYKLFDEEKHTIIIECVTKCKIISVVSWKALFEHQYGEVSLEQFRSGTNWVRMPNSQTMLVSIVHSSGRFIVDKMGKLSVQYSSHYVWWDESKNILEISIAFRHTKQFEPDVVKGRVEFATGLKYSLKARNMLQVAFGSGDCHALIAEVNIVSLYSKLDRITVLKGVKDDSEMQRGIALRKLQKACPNHPKKWSTYEPIPILN